MLVPSEVLPGAPAGSCKPPAGKPKPAEAGQAAISEKSPLRSFIVGTWLERTSPSMRRFHSCDQKKKILSFLIGPPNVYPKSLPRNLFFGQVGQPAFSSVSKEFSLSFRPE